jgi:hypothetical protein
MTAHSAGHWYAAAATTARQKTICATVFSLLDMIHANSGRPREPTGFITAPT